MISREVQRAVRRLEIRTRRALAGVWSGLAPSLFKGSGLEFEELRPYLPGDDVRTIDWKVTAKTGQAFVKQYAEQKERLLWLVVDQTASMDFGSGSRSKRDAAVEIATVFLLHAAHNRDRFGMCLHRGNAGNFLAASKGRLHAQRLIAAMLSEKGSTSSDGAQPIDLLRRWTRRRSLFIFVSDFLDQQFIETACSFAARHQVLAIRVVDPWERELPRAGLIRWRDAESGQTCVVDTSSNRVQQAYAAAANRRERQTREVFASHGIRTVGVVIDRSPAAALIQALGR